MLSIVEHLAQVVHHDVCSRVVVWPSVPYLEIAIGAERRFGHDIVAPLRAISFHVVIAHTFASMRMD